MLSTPRETIFHNSHRPPLPAAYPDACWPTPVASPGLRIWCGAARNARAWRLRLEHHGGRIVKRAVDIAGSAAALLMLAPLMLVITVLVKMQDGGPVLYWQARVGRQGRNFAFPKFRSMIMQAEEMQQALEAENDHGQSVTFKMKQDPRITPVGRILRRFSLDELPQLWCVLRGDMSLVGPRPPVPTEVARYTPQDRRRLEAKPGLTCIWQVSGRGDVPFDEQVKMDVEYTERQSLWLDLQLMLQTVPAVLSGRGAY